MHSDNIQTFQAGGMNQDDAPEFVPKNDYIRAFNIRNTGTASGETHDLTDPESNEFITGTRNDGINKGVGGRAFEDVGKIVFFVYNTAGNNQICVYDQNSGVETVIYNDGIDSGGEILLPLDPQEVVDCILINETYLVWVAKNLEVGYTNFNTLSDGGYGTVLAEDLSLIKPPCLPPITGVYASDKGKASNFLKQRLYQFICQYENADFNFTAWSTWSKRIIPPEESTPAIGTDVTENNCIIVSVNIGSIRAKTINIADRFSLFDYAIVKTVERDYVTALPDTAVDLENEIYEAYDPGTNIYSFVFYGDELAIAVPPLETDLAYDYIWPANAVEKINGNIIALGDIFAGYERPTTPIVAQAVGYDPNLTLPPDPMADPLKITYTFPGESGSGAGGHKRIVKIEFGGTPHTGDIITITFVDIRAVNNTQVYSFTVPVSLDGMLESVVATLAGIIPNSSYVSAGSGQYLMTTITVPYFGLQSTKIVIFNAGATISKSVHALLDNSSYQLAISYRDQFGRFFPLVTGNDYIVKTPSFAQLTGQAVSITWQIPLVAPVGAVDFQILITPNSTANSILDVLTTPLNYLGPWNAHTNMTPTLVPNTGTVGDTYIIEEPSLPTDYRNLGNGTQSFDTGDYVTYNSKGSWDIISKDFGDLTTTGNILALKLDSLNLFNTRYANQGSTTVLTYGYTPGDRCTLHYYIDADGNKVYINDPCVDLSILGYDSGSFLLKVEKSATFDETLIAGKDVYVRLTTPKETGATVSETVWFEIGERFTITNGEHDTLSGVVTDGDVYFKTRQYDGAVDPTVPYNVLSTDFNFSDFYVSNFTSYGRPRTFYDELEKTERKAIISHSESYVLGSRKNGLTRFYPENVYGDGDGQTSSSWGAIQILWQRGDILCVGQELNWFYIPVNQSILIDKAEQQQYAISEKLFNVGRTSTERRGLGKTKCFTFKNDVGWFVDPLRSIPCEIGLNGIVPMGGKMSKFFMATLNLAYSQGKIMFMYYDNFYNEVVLCIQTDSGILTFFPFSTTNWDIFDHYSIPNNGFTSVGNTANSTAVYNTGTGDVTYTPTPGFIGNNVGNFTFNPGTGAITKHNCLNWIAGNTDVNQFVFTELFGVEPSTVIVSNSISVIGPNIPVAISITGGQYSINGGAYTASAGTVVANDTITVRVTSSGSALGTASTTLTIGTTTGTFTVHTRSTANFGASAQYGFTITEIANNTATGVPAGFATVSVSPGSNLYIAYTAVTAGSINVRVTGTPSIPGHVKIDLIVAGVQVDSVIANFAGIYSLTFPSGESDPTTILVAVDTF